MKPIPTSLLVIKNKSILMQRILDYVGAGYDQYVTGTVDPGKLARFAEKMVINYQVDLDKHQRARRKRLGLGNAVLLLYCSNGQEAVNWWLLVSPGDHPAKSAEKLRFVKDLSVFSLNLVQETRRGTDKPVLTWGMKTELYQSWRNSLVATVCTRNLYQMEVILAELYRLPGFSGIRRSVGQLAVLYRAEVKRQNLTRIAPQPPKRLGYVRRLKTSGLSIRQLGVARKDDVRHRGA